MKTLNLIFILLFLFTTCFYAQDVFDYTSKAEVKKQEKQNESPYAIFGDNTAVLKTNHEEKKDHSLKVPLIENGKQIGLFELNFQTGVVFIFDTDGNLTMKQQLSHDELARFLSIDPHAENYYSWSPYAYVGNNPIRRIDPTGMDWYEDKDGNVKWEKDINKDSKLPKGSKYIGESYMGISIKQRETTEPSGAPSLTMEISYTDENGESNLITGFIQTVNTNSPKDGRDTQSIDAYQDGSNEFHENAPFYHSIWSGEIGERWSHATDKVWNGGVDAKLSDRPHRKSSNKNYKWQAETSIMKKQQTGSQGQGVNVPVATMQWGFTVRNGKVSAVSPVRVVQPSPYHSFAIGLSTRR